MRTLPFVRMALILTSPDALKLHMRDAIQHELEKTTPVSPVRNPYRIMEASKQSQLSWSASKKSN